MPTRTRYISIITAMALLIPRYVSIGAAAQINFTVDPTSSLDLVAVYSGVNLVEQGPGSLTTAYNGSITIDVDHVVEPSSLDFLSSALVAANSGNWLPEAGGGPAGGDTGLAEPANYAGFASTGALLGGDVYTAVRNLEFDTTTPGGALAVAGGAFTSTQTFTLTAGALDFNIEGGFLVQPDANSLDLANQSASNMAASASTYNRVGSIATLTLPIDIDIDIEEGTGTANVSGTITATADVSTGDFNQDGDKDGLDFLIWQDGFGALAAATLGDGDGDGTFDGAVLGDDLTLWESGLGESIASSGLIGSFGIVPEPSTLGLAFLLGLIRLRLLKRLC